MVYQSRGRKRFHALRLGSDGSAFHKWEEFMETCKDGDEVVGIHKDGFQTLKTMSKEERLPFVLQADKLKSAYQNLLDEEIEKQWVGDKVDSAEFGKYDEVLIEHWITKKAP